MIMENELDFGTRVLNGFLTIMVVILIGILLSVVIGLILAGIGIL